ncbi:TonB-dependent receptor [Pseudoalteromonas tunicata]|uniref:TonB-dependent receptor domain-containing protein n=1 Tax=Pseudoalteromonas tunicata TaxID=314281 RepID=UPI00273D2CC9|nr:TonB-dependent receptor [Pseudoalteromonas tunicata]MDP5213663.1 TonB-dependent receptor [Pseudoalteromonas tunicata]
MLRSKLAICISLSLLPALQNVYASSAITTLDKTTVTATRTEKATLATSHAINVLDATDIERKLSGSIFESLDLIPNASGDGGPFANGYKFNIRGFSDAEDVMVTLDGAVQTFEKYRMGSVFLDAELYRSVSIKRGPSTVLHGGGALGGLVQFELKNANDFLRDNQTIGAKVTLGHHSNNNQQNASVFAYAKPIEELDLLFAYIDRNSDDFKLSNDTTLDNSAVKSNSWLAKASYKLNDNQALSFNASQSQDAQRAEFNTTDTGAWGTVYRDVIQKTFNLEFTQHNSTNPWVDLSVKLGQSQSHVTESDADPALADFIGLESDYQYNLNTLDISNTSRFLHHALTYGLQYTNQERIGNKTAFPCLKLNRATYQCEQYGESATTAQMSSQPAGEQNRFALYIQDEFQWRAFTLTAGIRYEKYHSTPTTELLATLASNTYGEVKQDHVVPAASINYQASDNLNFFYTYQEGFRAPLIDELYDRYNGRLPNFNLAIETSQSHEVGATASFDDLLINSDSLRARIVYFDTAVDDEILSQTSPILNPAPAPRYSNLGSNDRHGYEFELSYANRFMYSNIVYSEVAGNDHNNEPLWQLPADTLVFDTGLLFSEASIGMTFKHLQNRQVKAFNMHTGQSEVTQHDGYSLINVYANWQINQQINLKLALDNLLDSQYQLVAGTGGAIGNYGVGRNAKVQISYQF